MNPTKMAILSRHLMGLLFSFLTVALIHASQDLPEPTQWPFSPRSNPIPPPLPADEIAANEIDHFIIDKLHQAGLKPAPKIEGEQLARRVYFDLIGLPPSPTELEAFLQDDDPKAFERLVDRLLEDPRYGERWARFWLDIARYADTAGYEGDPDLPYAWRYRDYVIDAFNQDKPYDLFIKEQLAGDEFKEIMGAGDLPNPEAEQTVALTFLRLAPFTEPRGDETRHEMLSEMTSTVSSAFLGLTVGCAQCHDHKYDPIPTRDFYRMKAFFSTVWLKRPEPGDIYQIGAPLPAKHYREGENERYEEMRADYLSEMEKAKNQLEELTSEFDTRLGPPKAGFGIQSSGHDLGNNYYFETTPVADGELHHSIVNSSSDGWEFFTDGSKAETLESLSGKNTGHWFASIPSPNSISLGQQVDSASLPKGNAHKGQIAEVLIYDHPLSEEERRAIDVYKEAKYGSIPRSEANPPMAGLSFWLDASDPDADRETPPPASDTTLAQWVDKIEGLRMTQSSQQLQPRVQRNQPTDAPSVLFEKSLLVAKESDAAFFQHEAGALVMIYGVQQNHRAEGYGFAIGGQRTFLSTVIYPGKGANADLNSILSDETNDLFSRDERDRFEYLSQRERFIKQHLKRLEPMAMSLRHSYGPPFEPGVPVSRIMLRGEHDNLGEVVQAGFPSAITGHSKPAEIRLDPFKRWPTRSRRMTLANWIASPDNPLTARVIVNRLWHWHFGQGIVKTPSDFGKLSGGPSHPQLLDWLANYLVEKEWHLKAVHRLIVTSRTYRQASHIDSTEGNRRDPENRLLWHFNPRRLEAEAIRDSILYVSGRLNSELYGPPIFPELPGGIEEQVKYNNSKWDTDPSSRARKRSIYVYQQRTLSMPFLQTFDALVCEDSRPMRRTSITPLQALAMYNGKLVNQEAIHFAQRIKKHATNPRERIQWAFRSGLSRQAREDEIVSLLPFAKDHQLPQLARIIFNTNEFVYID